jgi:hypothetical protein
MMTIEEAVERNIQKAPPFTESQVKLLKRLLNSGGSPDTHVRPEPRPETAQERDRRLGQELNERLSVCADCGLEEARHGYAEHFGHIGHRHVSLTLEERKRIIDRFMEENK